jgi:hypothetical protein
MVLRLLTISLFGRSILLDVPPVSPGANGFDDDLFGLHPTTLLGGLLSTCSAWCCFHSPFSTEYDDRSWQPDLPSLLVMLRFSSTYGILLSSKR